NRVHSSGPLQKSRRVRKRGINHTYLACARWRCQRSSRVRRFKAAMFDSGGLLLLASGLVAAAGYLWGRTTSQRPRGPMMTPLEFKGAMAAVVISVATF